MNKLNDLGIIIIKKNINKIIKNIYYLNKISIYSKKYYKYYNSNNIEYFLDIKKFILSISKPRRILILSNNSNTEKIINFFINYIEEKDIIINISNNKVYNNNFLSIIKWVNKFKILFLNINIFKNKEMNNKNIYLIISNGNLEAFKNITKIINNFKNNKNIIKVYYFGKNNNICEDIKMNLIYIKYFNKILSIEIFYILKYIFNFNKNNIKKIINFKKNNILYKNVFKFYYNNLKIEKYYNKIIDKIKKLLFLNKNNNFINKDFLYINNLFYDNNYEYKNKYTYNNVFNIYNKNKINNSIYILFYILHIKNILYIYKKLEDKKFKKNKINYIIKFLIHYKYFNNIYILKDINKLKIKNNIKNFLIYKYKCKIDLYINDLKKIVILLIKNNIVKSSFSTLLTNSNI